MLSCVRYPFYSKMNRGDWQKDTTWVSFPSLPAPVKDTLTILYKKYNSEKDYSLSGFISLDTNYSFELTRFYSFDSPKLIIPFGTYFKLNKQKLFEDYSEGGTPLIYYNKNFYYPSREFSVKKERVTKEDYSDYENRYIVKYKLKKKWLK